MKHGTMAKNEKEVIGNIQQKKNVLSKYYLILNRFYVFL